MNKILSGYFVNRGNWTALERQMGRPMRGPDGDHGAFPGAPPGFVPNDAASTAPPVPPQNPTPDQNNQQGNPPAPNGDSNSQNNNSQPDPFSSFWDSDGDSGNSSSSDSNAAKNPGSSSTDSNNGQPPENPAQRFAQQLNDFPIGEVFTRDIAEQMNNGDFKGANEAIQNNIRGAMRQVFASNVGVLQEFAKVVTGQMEERINARMGEQRNYDALVEAIPRAADKRVGPVIRNIYEQALSRAKGDSSKAVAETKQFLTLMTKETADELGFDVAPRDPHSRQPTRTVNWLEELAAN